MPFTMGPNNYGKSGIRLVRVGRESARHELRDLTVHTALSGDLDATHYTGDNTGVLPTDTQKNTVYAFARDGVGTIETFAERLARHFVDATPSITTARVRIEEHAWTRIGDHSFTRGEGGELRTTEVAYDGAEARTASGVRDLLLLNTTDSEFTGFLADEYTTLPETDLAAAIDVVSLYRLRWRIEQCFRMLKSDGLDLEAVQTSDPHRLFNLATLAAGAAVRIIQLVDARDGSPRPADDVASEGEIAAATALCPKLEGKTERQRNSHPPRSLAWLAWIIARLGGWNCYYKPPGPKTMRRGWDRFAAIAEGFTLAHAAPRNV